MRTVTTFILTTLLCVALSHVAPPHHHLINHLLDHHHKRKHCGLFRSLSLDADDVREELFDKLDTTPEFLGQSPQMTRIFTNVADTIAELTGDNVSPRTGRHHSDRISSLDEVLKATEEFISPTDKLDQQLIAAKIDLVDTTRKTLEDLLADLQNFARFQFFSESNKDIKQTESLLAKTKKVYTSIYENAAHSLRTVMESDGTTLPTKKLIAIRVLQLATNNIRSYADIRKKMFRVLIRISERDLNRGVVQDHSLHNLILSEAESAEQLAQPIENPLTHLSKEEEEELQLLLDAYEHEIQKED